MPSTTNTGQPTSIRPPDRVQLGHGGGEEVMRDIVGKLFTGTSALATSPIERDAAVLDLPSSGRLAFATDSFVVKPLFFPGGNIGDLAVNSTVNDLAMVGARPLFLSVAFILEEGLPLVTLDQITTSMRSAAKTAGVHIVTGDTKVVERGNGDGIFINTTGVGVVDESCHVGPHQVQSGDAILVSGDIGRHGIAVLSARQELGFHTKIVSDCAPLTGLVSTLLDGDIEIRCMRDLTRGGLASALIEIARSASLDIEIDEERVPINRKIAAVCELANLDPMYVANQGRMVVFVAAKHAEKAINVMRNHPMGEDTHHIGSVGEEGSRVRMRTSIGTQRILDPLDGEKLPRVC